MHPIPSRANRKAVVVDCALILAIGVAAQTAAFTSKMGRAIVCTDSYQYVAAAEALLDPDQVSHFDMRKPGYPFFLAGVWAVAGRNMWSAVVANHVLLSMLPLAAYGFGLLLRSRGLGWLAALLMMARLQMAFAWRTEDVGNWIMSETLYTFLLSFGLLAFFVGLRHQRAARWLLVAGAMLGLAWLTRGAATAVIPVAFFAVFFVHRHRLGSAAVCGVALLAPIVSCVLLECGLNYQSSGEFRPSTGTNGSCMWSYRLRAHQHAETPDTAEGRRLALLLPERSIEDAFVVDPKDQWVAIARAVRTKDLTYREYDDLCRQVAWNSITADPWPFVKHSVVLAGYHLFRLMPPWTASATSPDQQNKGKTPSNSRASLDRSGDPFASWSLPYISAKESESRVAEMREEAAERAPFAGSGVWSTLAYWRSKPSVVTPTEALAKVSLLWPGFAIILCPLLGLNRRMCWTLAAIYAAEAVALSLVTVTDNRYQSVWMVTDTVLAAALPAFILTQCVVFVKSTVTRLVPSPTADTRRRQVIPPASVAEDTVSARAEAIVTRVRRRQKK